MVKYLQILLLLTSPLCASTFKDFISQERTWLASQGYDQNLLPYTLKPLKVLSQNSVSEQSFKAYVAKYLNQQTTDNALICLRQYQSQLKQMQLTYEVPGHILCSLWALNKSVLLGKPRYDSMPLLAGITWQHPQRYLANWRQYLVNIAQQQELATVLADLRFVDVPASFNNLHPLGYYQQQAVPTLAVLKMWAQYLQQQGWRGEWRWGRQVRVNANLLANMDLSVWHPISYWRNLGVKKTNGKSLPNLDLPARLIMLDQLQGRQYLVYKNYIFLEKLYQDQYFSFAVAILGDRILYHRS